MTAPPPAPQVFASEHQGRARKSRVLAFDDNAVELAEIAQQLAMQNYDVMPVRVDPVSLLSGDAGGIATAHEVVALLRQYQLDAVVTDFGLANFENLQDGYMLVDTVRQSMPSLPCIVRTGARDGDGAVATVERDGKTYDVIGKTCGIEVLDHWLGQHIIATQTPPAAAR